MAVSCSQCGVEKREVNHWYFGWLERAGQRLCIVPWNFDDHLQYDPTIEKLCGDQCCHKFLQKFADFMKATQ